MKVKVNDIQINYEVSGKQGAPAVILSHSLGSSMVMWNPQMEALEPRYLVLPTTCADTEVAMRHKEHTPWSS
jgi:hypothetical protein